MSGPRSVRVNLSIPASVDAVLADLAAHTGRGKASFAAEALTWYLPHLEKLLREFEAPRDGKRAVRQEPVTPAKMERLSPAQRLQQQAAAKRRQEIAAKSGAHQELRKGL